MSAAAGRKKPASAAGGKKKAGAEKPPLDDLEGMDSESLAEELRKQSARLADVRRSRNYAQLEKDQVAQLHAIVADEVSKTQSHLRNLDSQMERMQDTHRNDIRIYLQKVVHLDYEHDNNVAAVEGQAHADREAAVKQHENNKKELHDLKLQLKHTLSKTEVAREEEIKRLKEVERKEMQKLREQFERNYQDLLANYESRLQNLREDLDLRKKLELHEISERKNRHINDLLIQHHKNFEEMRAYYNSITQDNLDLIKELNAEIEDLKVAHQANERAMETIEKKNASLSEPLMQAENRVKALRHKLANYDKDQMSLRHAKARLLLLEETYKNLSESALKRREEFARVEAERDRLYRTFEETVLAVQRVGASKNESLESLLEEYSELFDIKKAQFTSVLRASNLDPAVLASVTQKLDDVLQGINERQEALQYELARATKAGRDIKQVYVAKLRQMGVPEEQLQIDPAMHADAQYLRANITTAPADLIVQ